MRWPASARDSPLGRVAIEGVAANTGWMTSGKATRRNVDFDTVVGPSRWWEIVEFPPTVEGAVDPVVHLLHVPQLDEAGGAVAENIFQ